MIVVLNGELRLAEEALVPVSGALASFGEGVLEVFRTTPHGPFLVSRHLARMKSACRRLGIPSEGVDQDFVHDLSVLSEAGDGPWRIRLVRSQGASGVMRALMAEPLVETELVRTGARLTLREGIVTPLGLKTTSYAASRAFRRDAVSLGFDECLLHFGGELLEGASSNICLVKGGTVITPSSPWILEGVTLGRVLEFAAASGLEVSRRAVRLRELSEADEVFMTSAIRGPIAVRTVDAYEYPLGSVYAGLRRQYDDDLSQSSENGSFFLRRHET